MARHARIYAVERRVSAAEDLRRRRHRRRVGREPEEERRVGEVRRALEAQRFGEIELDHLAEPFRRLQADGADAAGGDHEYVGQLVGRVSKLERRTEIEHQPAQAIAAARRLGKADAIHVARSARGGRAGGAAEGARLQKRGVGRGQKG